MTEETKTENLPEETKKLLDEINSEINTELQEPEEFEYNEEDYQEWFKKQQKEADEVFKEFYLTNTKTFDDLVDKYQILVGLKGMSYDIATRMIFYSVIANQLKNNMFTFDNNKLDLRMSLFIQLKAGHGKKNYERFVRRTIQGLGKEYQEPTSYHPEQFVGKIIVKERDTEDDKYIPIPGTLASDFLVLDEAHALLTLEKYEECLKYLRTALDPIGSNWIEKKQVNVPDEFKLRYPPNCSVLILTQPISNINEDLLIRGSFRRFYIVFIYTSLEERLKAVESSTFLTMNEESYEKLWTNWIHTNKLLSEFKNLKFVCTDYSAIDKYIREVAKNVEKSTPEVLEYFGTNLYTMKINIFRMAIIRAIINHNHEGIVTITPESINAAIKDWDRLWQLTITWIAQQMKMISLNPLGWKDEKHGIVAEILKKNHNISRQDLLEKYCKVTNLNKDTLNIYLTQILKDFKKWNLIEMKYSGERNIKIVIWK